MGSFRVQDYFSPEFVIEREFVLLSIVWFLETSSFVLLNLLIDVRWNLFWKKFVDEILIKFKVSLDVLDPSLTLDIEGAKFD